MTSHFIVVVVIIIIIIIIISFISGNYAHIKNKTHRNKGGGTLSKVLRHQGVHPQRPDRSFSLFGCAQLGSDVQPKNFLLNFIQCAYADPALLLSVYYHFYCNFQHNITLLQCFVL